MSEETLLQEPSAEPVAEAVTETPQEPVAAPTSERPEWLPEKYKTPEDLAKAYKELEGKLGTKEEEIRARLLQELEATANEGLPASAGEYEVPDFVDDETAKDSALLKQWADHCFENKYSQEEFNKGLELYMSAMGEPVDLQAEAMKLGENANTRIDAANAFARSFFPKEVMPAIERMCETSEGIIALEKIMEAMKDGDFTGNTSAASGQTEAELRQMMQDERYWNPVRMDRDYIRQVEEGFKKLYG